MVFSSQLDYHRSKFHPPPRKSLRHHCENSLGGFPIAVTGGYSERVGAAEHSAKRTTLEERRRSSVWCLTHQPLVNWDDPYNCVDRQIDREIDRQIDRERQIDRQTEKDRQKQKDRQIDRQIRQIDRWMDGWMDRQIANRRLYVRLYPDTWG